MDHVQAKGGRFSQPIYSILGLFNKTHGPRSSQSWCQSQGFDLVVCRYITRPALANERVQTNAAGQVVLKLKTPWRDGTTHLVMSFCRDFAVEKVMFVADGFSKSKSSKIY